MRSFSKILIATFSPVGMWVANLTFPNVPFPKVFSELNQMYILSNCLFSFLFAVLGSPLGCLVQTFPSINIRKIQIIDKVKTIQ